MSDKKVFKVCIKNPEDFSRALTMALGVVEEIVELGSPMIGLTSRVDLARLEEILEGNGIDFEIED